MSRESDELANIEIEKLRQENVRKSIQILHDLDADTRQRIDTLAKLIFVLSGGALTVSLGLFLRESAPQLSDGQLCTLTIAWYCLFASMAAFAIILALLIIDGYVVGRERERRIGGEEPNAHIDALHNRLQRGNWIIGVLGFVSFLIGILMLAVVATGLLSK